MFELMFVLGIDPGVSRCGYGCVRRRGSKLSAVAGGVLTTPPSDPLPERLGALAEDLESLIAEMEPDVVVVEKVFFQTNARTAMSVGQASGLALAAAARAGCGVVEYTSNEVKQAVAGYGSAEKYQVQRMVQVLLHLSELPKPPDAADALALAICHLTVAPMMARAEQAERKLARQLEGRPHTQPDTAFGRPAALHPSGEGQ
jgi:crossover junction endodeoxyribonuclease RuvC